MGNIAKEEDLLKHTVREDEYLLEDDEKGEREQEDVYRIKMRYTFLPISCFMLVGGFFNNTFQAFIKQQFEDSMRISDSQYNLFVLIPPLPNIILPLFAGPIYTFLGLRSGLFIFSLSMLVGMSICFASTYNYSLILMIIGKTIHQIGNEMFCIGQSTMVSMWFDSKTLAFALAWASVVAKLSGSIGGVSFPQLYNISNDLQIPLLMSISTCLFSFFCTLGVIYLDKEADRRLEVVDKRQIKEDSRFNLSHFTDFSQIYYMYAAQAAFLFGSFYAFESYLHSILTVKFGIDKTTAGTMTSIPFWIVFMAPIFGKMADKYGKRILGLFCTALVALISIIIIILLPNNTHEIIIYIPLVTFGVFLSMMSAYLFPCLPLLCKPHQVKMGFGISYATKNMGLSAFGFIGGSILGDGEKNYDMYLIFFISIFTFSCLLQIYTYIIDRRAGGNVNSQYPIVDKRNYILSIKMSLGGSII